MIKQKSSLPMLVSLTTSDIKQSNSLYFKHFKPLSHYSSILDKIEGLISARDYDAAMDLSQNLRSLALQGLHYFQTYDWLMLFCIICTCFSIKYLVPLDVIGSSQEIKK